MKKKKFTVQEIKAYKRRAQEVAEIFGEDLTQEVTALYVRYIDGKKDALLENYIQTQRKKHEEKNKQEPPTAPASSQFHSAENTSKSGKEY